MVEIRDHMSSWQAQNIIVDERHHWPGEMNIADMPKRGKVTYTEVGPNS